MQLLKLYWSLTLIFTFKLCIAQEDFPIAGVPAEYPGGYQAFYYFVNDSLQYPAEAKEKGIEGKVYVQFVIDKTGDLVNESVVAVKSDNELLNQAAIDVVKKSPNWIPARLTKKGAVIKQRIIMPITFKLSPGKRKHKKKKRGK